jgi:hypothetical protein
MNFPHVAVVYSRHLAIVPSDRHRIPARFGDNATVTGIAAPINAGALFEVLGFVYCHGRCSWALPLVNEHCRAHELGMEKFRFDDTDYSVVVKNRGSPPNPWKWEIYRAGKSNPIGQSPVFFHTMAAANKAGKAALKQLLATLNV